MASNQTVTVIDSARVEEAQAQQVPLVDIRPAFMYEEGHIPGAISVPLVVPKNGSMVPDDEIVAAVEAAGVAPGDDVVLYCQTGCTPAWPPTRWRTRASQEWSCTPAA